MAPFRPRNAFAFTILMALVDEVAVPCAYFLSNSRETDTYELFFKVSISFSMFPLYCSYLSFFLQKKQFL